MATKRHCGLRLSVRKGWPDPALIPKLREIERGLRAQLGVTVRVAPMEGVVVSGNSVVYDLEVDARYDLATVQAAVMQTIRELPIVTEAKAHVHVALGSREGSADGIVAPYSRNEPS